MAAAVLGARFVALISAARAGRVALFWPARTGRRDERGEAQEGSVQLEVAVPSLLGRCQHDRGGRMSQVIIGMDPHKRSATIEIMTSDETVVSGGRYGTDPAGYRAMLAAVRQWPERTWAIEGCQGIGRHIASRL